MHRGPDRGDAHAVVAVAADRDRQPARALERERGADRVAGPAADAAAALGADVIERMVERPGGAVPGQRQVGERHVTFADRGLERAREIIDPQRPSGRLVLFRLGLHRRRLGCLGAAERREQLRHRLVRRRRQQQVDRRQGLVVHAPAAVDVEVGAHIDDLRLRRIEAEAAAQAPARSTQSSARITSAALIASIASGTSAFDAGAPACSG